MKRFVLNSDISIVGLGSTGALALLEFIIVSYVYIKEKCMSPFRFF